MTHPSSPPAPMTAEQIDRLRVIVQGMTPGLDRDIFEKLLRCIDALTARVAELERDALSALKERERLSAAAKYLLLVRDVRCQHNHPPPDASCARCALDAALRGEDVDEVVLYAVRRAVLQPQGDAKP